MKKTITIVAVIACFSFANAPKPLTVTGDVNEWSKHLQKLGIIRQIADQSDLPNQTVKFITKTIDSIEMFVVPQLNKQLSDTTKKK